MKLIDDLNRLRFNLSALQSRVQDLSVLADQIANEIVKLEQSNNKDGSNNE